MADNTVNPYQAPADEVAQAEPGNGWSVSGDYLVVRPGTILPPVAMEGGGTILTPVLYRFNVLAGGPKAMMGAIIPMALVFVWLIWAEKWVGEEFRWAGLVVLAILATVISGRFAKVIPAMVWGFAPVEALRKRARQKMIGRVLLGAGLFILAGSFIALVVAVPHYVRSARTGFDIDGILAWLLPALGISVALMIASVACSGFKPGVTCALFKDGWLYLKGVPRESLARFGAKSMDPLPGKRMRKVYKQYLHRQPLDRLLGKKKWNLWNALRFSIWKSQRSPRLESLGFPWCERVGLPLPEADADLVKMWKTGSTGTPLENWPAVMAGYLDSPGGMMRIGFLFHASPDLRHFANVAVIRVAGGNLFEETFQFIIRTWLDDGNAIFTNTPPPAPLAIPESVDWMASDETPGQVWKLHQERIGTKRIRAARSVEEFSGWMEELAEEFDAAAEAMGLQSPAYEMELHDPPK